MSAALHSSRTACSPELAESGLLSTRSIRKRFEPTATHDVPGIREGGSVSRLTVLPGGSLLVYRDEEDGGSDGVFFEPDSGAFGDELAPGASSRSVTPDPSGDGAFFVAGDSIHWINARTFEVGEAGTSPLNNPTAVVTLSSGIVAAVAPDPAGGNSVTLAPLSGDGDRLEFAIEPSAHDITAVISLGSRASRSAAIRPMAS